MTPYQIKILSDALDNLDLLTEFQNDFILTLSNRPAEYVLRDTECGTLSDIAKRMEDKEERLNF